MIGLHISNKKKYQESKHSHVYEKCGDTNITVSFHDLDYRQVYFENEDVQVFIDGWIFNAEDYGSQALFVAMQYTKHKENFVQNIEGQFNIFIFDKNIASGFFANDIFSFRKHFVLADEFVISTDLEFLYSHLDHINFNHDHILKNLNQNRYVSIHETFVEEVLMVKPASLTDFHTWRNYSTGVFEEKYRFKEGIVDPILFVEEVKKNIIKIHRNHPVVLQLSGGMDSRLLAEFFRDLEIQFQTLSYGIPESDELKIAQLVSIANDVEAIEIEYKAEDFIRNAEAYMLSTGGLDIFVQSAFQKIISSGQANYLKNYVFETGFALDSFIGGTQIDKQNDSTSHCFTKDIFDLNKNDIYASELRIFSQLTLRQSFHREFKDDRYAMFCYENYYLMRSIPLDLLRDYKFYYQIAEHAIVNSREVPLQRTMTPFYKTPSQFTLLELQKREKESIKAFIERGELEPNNRYYSDFDMWLRSDPYWEALVEKTLLKENPKISRYISQDKIKDIIMRHNDGTEPNMRLLIRLISTELFMKTTSQHKLVENE